MVFMLGIGTTTVEATNEISPPDNIDLRTVFITPNNSTSVVTNANRGSILELTRPNRSGGVWSKEADKLDLYSDFEASMYIYFGNDGKDTGDGLAFVLQNDPGGNSALKTSFPSQLGIWESPFIGGGFAMMNSFAIEIDTFYDEYFDRGQYDPGGGGNPARKENHIAWNFPNVASSYVVNGPNRTLIHQNRAYPGGLSTDKWYPFTVKWSASRRQITYQFGDLAPVVAPISNPTAIFGTNRVFWGITGSSMKGNQIYRIAFDKLPGAVKAGARTTITRKSTNENIAGKVVDSGETLTYRLDANFISGIKNWEGIVAEMKLSKAVEFVPGSLRGKLAVGGEVPLSNDLVKDGFLKAPIGTLSGNSRIAYVYFDVVVKSNPETNDVTESSKFLGTNHIEASNEVSYKISQNQPPSLTLVNENTVQEISSNTNYDVTGTWKDPDGINGTIYYLVNGKEVGKSDETSSGINQDTPYSFTIPAAELKLDSENELEVYVVDKNTMKSQSKSLKIKVLASIPVITLDLASTTIPITDDFDYEITGTWKESDSPWVDLYYSVGQNPPVQFATNVPNSDPKGQFIKYKTSIPNTQFTLGANLVSVYAKNSDGRLSKSETLTLDVSGSLKFTNVSPKISYELTEIPKNKVTVKRNNDWDIRVKDTRNSGSQWHVTVGLSKEFTNQNKQTLTNGLFYKTATSTETFLKEGESIVAFSKTTTDVQEVSINWPDKEGLLMQVNPEDYIGNYQGILEWTLTSGSP